ncbi:MAG: NADH:ubiquinone oxidoreductase [Magnetococcales bacterium]|nr:NADH:ubiquinone oxidoreductase [Magnetococcales bacterium]NGZ07184.1 NADH:ubiquinone oxidoreductase [Magnetococcales bacterium]
MSMTLYWMQNGGCGGDTMSFLNVEAPNLMDLFQQLDIELLWHPSLSSDSPRRRQECVDALLIGQRPLDILVIEGAVLRGPASTGMYDTHQGKPKKDLIVRLAHQARHVIALGTCASFGGFGVDEYVQACGLQFVRNQPGGLLGSSFRSRSGVPVINLAGCPCHPEVLSGTLTAVVTDAPLPLDDLQRPLAWYGMLVHQGCTRNEYHEYRMEENDFGQKGCLFFHKGCHGPLVGGPCNKLLWNRRSSKTRAGVPCFGCTNPDFPMSYPFFETRHIEDIPLALPNGINRAHYLVYKTMAAAAAPARLKRRETEI